MASAPTHIVATSAIAAFFHKPRVPWHLWFFGALLAVAPDLDVLAPRVPVAYRDLVAHRGLSHSLLMAAVVSTLIVLLFYRDGAWPLRAKRVWLFLFLAMASHGLLDALTNGGPGVAFFAPFSAKRYFFPYRPLLVSPLSIQAFLTSRGVAILLNEMRWVWAPSVGLAAVVLTLRAWLRPPPRRPVARPRPASQPRPAPAIPSAPKRSFAPPPPPPPPPPTRPAPPPPPRFAPGPPPPPLEPLPAAPLAPEPEATPATLASPSRHRARLVIVAAVVAVIAAAGVFVAVQPVVPPQPLAVEEAPAQVAPPPPKPLQAEAEGYYEPGYKFTVADRRFTRLTLRPDPMVTFTRPGTRQEFGCFEALITPQTLLLRCEIERVGVMTIDGRFVNRVATTRLDAPALSAVVTVRNARGEVLYSARDTFVWRPPE
jgi:inner membrane protein